MKQEIKNLELKIKNSEEKKPVKIATGSGKEGHSKKSVEVRALYVKISFQKLNLMAKVVRRRSLAEVRRVLTFSKTKAGYIILKLLKSAEAAAVQRGLDPKKLYLSKLLTQQGPSLKRSQPVSRGSSHPIAKKSSHLILELKQKYGTKS